MNKSIRARVAKLEGLAERRRARLSTEIGKRQERNICRGWRIPFSPDCMEESLSQETLKYREMLTNMYRAYAALYDAHYGPPEPLTND